MMRPKKAKACPNCETVIGNENPLTDGFICGECESFYEDVDEARDCCKED